jgi:hypothetical protein
VIPAAAAAGAGTALDFHHTPWRLRHGGHHPAESSPPPRSPYRRETDGEWTNVWWVKTDDDSGNTGVFVSGVYIKGGDNDEPVPGLPAC